MDKERSSVRVVNKDTGEVVREVACDGSVLIIDGRIIKVGKTAAMRADNKTIEKGTDGMNLYVVSDTNNLDLGRGVLLQTLD